MDGNAAEAENPSRDLCAYPDFTFGKTMN